MNEDLQAYARTSLKEMLNKCTSDQQMLFKRMYSHNNLDLPMVDVVDRMPADTLDRAMTQCRRTVEKNEADGVVIAKKWRRYRFYTKSLEDYRPLEFDTRYPWWCSGETADSAVIVAYLPSDADLSTYWDDAYDVTYDECDEIEFSGRFPQPEYFVPS